AARVVTKGQRSISENGRQRACAIAPCARSRHACSSRLAAAERCWLRWWSSYVALLFVALDALVGSWSGSELAPCPAPRCGAGTPLDGLFLRRWWGSRRQRVLPRCHHGLERECRPRRCAAAGTGGLGQLRLCRHRRRRPWPVLAVRRNDRLPDYP